jgi:integrase
MLSTAVSSYLALRRAAGFGLDSAGQQLESFAAYTDRQDRPFVHAATAIEWARLSKSRNARPRRLGDVARMMRFLHAEDERHEIPPAVFGSRIRTRPTPFILGDKQITEIVRLAAQSGYRTLRWQTYSTLFALLACTGLRLGEAIRLRYTDITPDGLMIRANTKFNKSRLVPLHETARAGLEQYLRSAGLMRRTMIMSSSRSAAGRCCMPTSSTPSASWSRRWACRWVAGVDGRRCIRCATPSRCGRFARAPTVATTSRGTCRCWQPTSGTARPS